MSLLAAFLLGLGGSLHCAAMCGPLLVAINLAQRQTAARSLVYHGGRIVTYMMLGAVSGLIGAAIVLAGLQRWLSLGAGILVLAAALVSFRAQWGGLAARAVGAVKSKFGRLLARRTWASTALLGGLNGLLPCGLVYIACAAAAAAGTVRGGIATMLAFGLGTAPLLLSIAFAGKAFVKINPLRLKRVVLTCATIAGLLLIVRGLSLGIPYLSPHYSVGQGPTCCHHAAGIF